MNAFSRISIFIVATFACSTDGFSQSQWTKDSTWKSINRQFPTMGLYQISVVVPFNNDTVLAAGYMGDGQEYNSLKNIVYQTLDAGKTWRKLRFQGNAWIYRADFEGNGKVWMGGSDEVIHYSSDFGITWTTMPRPFGVGNRVLSIYMVDSRKGLAGSLDGRLAVTNDNWKSSREILTPMDQGECVLPETSYRPKMGKVAMLDSVMLIQLGSRIYFSRFHPVKWKQFNIPVLDFTINKKNKTIALNSIRSKVYVVDSRLNLKTSYYTAVKRYSTSFHFNDTIDFNDFLSSGIQRIDIVDHDYVPDSFSYHRLFYKEIVKKMSILDSANLFRMEEILRSTVQYAQPQWETFSFTREDYDSYDSFYARELRNGDCEVDMRSNHFLYPEKAMNYFGQALLDSIYTGNGVHRIIIALGYDLEVNVINGVSDTLRIASGFISLSNSSIRLSNIPWSLTYKGKYFETYDTRITRYLRNVIPKEYDYYHTLFYGELIFRLIEQRTANELRYENRY